MSLEVYNILGEKLETLFEGYKNTGIYEENFSAENNNATGLYLFKLSINEYVQIIRGILLK